MTYAGTNGRDWFVARALRKEWGKEAGQPAPIVRFEDTTRDRVFVIQRQIEWDRARRIEVETTNGQRLAFVPLTLELWHEHFAEHVPAPRFASTDELQAFYAEGGDYQRALLEEGAP